MSRNPVHCRSRIPLDQGGDHDQFLCAVVARITNVSDRAVSGVSHDVCEACCRCLKPGEELNPVVASLVYNATATIVRAGGMPGCDRGRALSLQERIVTHLGIVA